MSALVKIIKNPFEKDEINLKVKAKTRVKDIKGVDPNNLVVYVNGKHVENDYVLKNGDCCVVRQYPADAGFWIVTGIIVGGALLGGADELSQDLTGKHLWELKKGDLKKLFSPESNGVSNQQQITSLPSVSGSKNQSAFGKVVPLILGKTYFTPYTECKTAYNTISGADGCDQYYHCLYIVGQKDLQIENVSMGLEVLASNSNHKTNDFLDITSEKFPVAKYNTQLELQCGLNEVSIFPQKVVQENMSMQLLNTDGTGEYVYAFTSRYAEKVELEFSFGGLIGYESNGTEKNANVDITVEYSFDGGETWHWGGDPNSNCYIDFTGATITHSYDSTTHKTTFSGKKKVTLRYVLKHTLSYTEMEDCLAQTVSYRIKRTNAESTDTNVVDKIYLTAVRTWCYDATATEKWASEHPLDKRLIPQVPMIQKVRNKTTRLGFSIKVDANVENYFDKINLIATSKASIYDGTGWTKTLYPTRNPVALTLYCMIGDFRDSYAYNTSGETYISCPKIDLDDFAEKYQICEEVKFADAEAQYKKRYYCDGVVLNPTKTVDLLNSILRCCRSHIVIKGNKYGIFMDKEQDYPLLVLNNNNLLSLTYSKSFDEIPDGHRVKYVSSLNYYQQDTIDVRPIGSVETENEKLVNVEYPYIADPYHAQSMSLYEQACLKLRPETMQAKVTGEGGLAEVGSLITIQSDVVTVGIGDGAEIIDLVTSGNTITGIKTDGRFAVTDITKEYGVVINIVDSLGNEKIIKKKVAGFSAVGEYSNFTFDTPASAGSGIEEGCIISFGLYGSESMDVLCVGKKENDDNTYELTLVPYDENIYLADEGAIPDFDPKTTPPQESGLPINYGDPDPNIKKEEAYRLYVQNMQRIAELAANHIVTLYKYSETDLSTTGIGTTLVYNFLNDTITWGDPSLSNGWSVTVPNDLTDVWVTSATAHGQSQTDTINSNEWARPIKVGQNGVNGLNTCTISLYKRLSTTPQDLPATVTYNFANASMVCSNWNGWSTSIPPIEEEDNNPCWEIHATALSTSTTDTIESSEWSECAKILSEGLSKQEVLDLIGERINETPNVLFTPSEGMFAVDEDGIVSTPQTAFMDVRVIQNDEDITFSFGQIDLPSGMTVSVTVLEQGTRLNFTVAQGTRLERNVIKVPVIFTAYADNDVLVDENGNPLVWVEDEDGRWYGDCSSVGSLPVAVSGGFIYWNGIDTTASEELVEGGVFHEGTFYTYNGTKWKESKVKPIGIQTEATSPTTYDVYYTASIVKGGRYDGGVKTVASIPSNPVIGDYFTWTGADQTPYEGSGFTKLASGCVYKWNGTAWEKDTSGKHLGTALPDILEVAESELVENNSDVVEKVGKMIAWDVVTQNIKVTGEALINSAIIADLTLGDSSHPNSGSFKSWNYVQGSDGFKLNPNGTAELNDAIIRGTVYASAGSFTGDITAEHLYLGSGVSIGANKITGLADVATSGDFDDLNNVVVEKTQLGTTVIQNGKIVTDLINVTTLLAQNLIMNSGGTMKSENFALGKEGWKFQSDGQILGNKALFAHDLEAPLWTAWISDISDVTIDLTTESASTIKTKLDSLFTNYGIRTFEQDDAQGMYVYANVVSNDENNLYVNYVQFGDFTERLAHYICRYIHSGKQYYVISSIEGGLISLERKLLEVTNSGSGTVTKFTSNYASNKLLIKSVSSKFEVFSDFYARGQITARHGHYVFERCFDGGSYTQPISKKGQVFFIFDVALEGKTDGGISCWCSNANDGKTKRYPVNAYYTDSNKNVIRVCTSGNSYSDFPKDSTDSCDIRYIYL